MADFLINMAQFIFQTVIVVAALLVLIAFVASLAGRHKAEIGLEVGDLNQKFNKNHEILQKTIFNKKEFKKILKQEKIKKKKKKHNGFSFSILKGTSKHQR